MRFYFRFSVLFFRKRNVKMQKKSIEKKLDVSLTETNLQNLHNEKLKESFCIDYIGRDDYVGETVETAHFLKNVYEDEWGNTYVTIRESISYEDSDGLEEKNTLLLLRFFLDSDDYTIIDFTPDFKVPQAPKKRKKEPISDDAVCSRYRMSIKKEFSEHGVDLQRLKTSFYRNENGNLVIDVKTYSNSKMRPHEYKHHEYKMMIKRDIFTDDYVGINMDGVEFI